ncbi:murein L,D-transpeptidase family protein [Vibrio sp. HB161653]|uniref:L,D-transpeptidase family protein n=1 Tax=Vibrio sp. HB161653 TaxID=3068274 RepID=UPI0035314E23
MSNRNGFAFWLSVLVCSLGLSAAAYAEVDKVKVDKSVRRLYVLDNNEVVKTFRIALGGEPRGAKREEGDQKTPEGVYYLEYVNDFSQFYRSVHISYPNAQDIQSAYQRNVSPGGNIKIHGLKNDETEPPSFVLSFDWTDGCIAMSNEDMDEFIRLVPMGTPIEIYW